MKLLFLTLIFNFILFPCTTAIISGKITQDGRPILFKHRDSDHFQNRLVYLKDGKYEYIGLVNSTDVNNKEIWAGCNSEGFAIMNSASYNLEVGNAPSEFSDREGIVMKLALQSCATVDEFEALLKSLPKPLGVEANFGVIDALGNGAYFETNNYIYTKFDINDSKVAPDGYLIRTNYSFSGVADKGYGYIRYQNALNLIKTGIEKNILTPEYFTQNISRSTFNSLTKIDLSKRENATSEYSNFEDFIPRYSTTSSIVIQGVKIGENKLNSTIWTVLGFPFTSVSIPIIFKAGDQLPKTMIANEKGNSVLCEKALILKKEVFAKISDFERKYINANAIFNTTNTGIYQKISEVEKEIFLKFNKLAEQFRENKIQKSDVLNYYNWIDEIITSKYKELFGI